VSADSEIITVGGVAVQVTRKRIKHVYIRVDPPEGRVRVSAPCGMDDRSLRLVVVARLDWIRRQRDHVAGAGADETARFRSGETHYLRGEAMTLAVIEHNGPPSVRLAGGRSIELRARPHADAAARGALLEDWYRALLRSEIGALVRKWETVMGVHVAQYRIRRMKTRWGSCNVQDRRIWLNLELVKHPLECLEYVVVHEMTHLIERGHNARFYGLMDSFMPDWRNRREWLQRGPRRHAGG